MDSTNTPEQFVFIVDDDEAMRRSVEFLLRTAGLRSRSFASARQFLDAYDPEESGCVLLDVRMPGMDGLELQEHIRSRRIGIPVIILTAYGNVQMAVRAMQAGASDFLEKPFGSAALLERVHRALAGQRRRRRELVQRAVLQRRYDDLTPREREVLLAVVGGMLNKQIAGKLGISIKTVENHRASLMDKMRAENLADLVRMAITLELL